MVTFDLANLTNVIVFGRIKWVLNASYARMLGSRARGYGRRSLIRCGRFDDTAISGRRLMVASVGMKKRWSLRSDAGKNGQ